MHSRAALLLASVPLLAGDWPQWRGPSSLGISAENGLPERWSATQNVAWRAKLAGFGASSPVVAGGLVVVTSQTGGYKGSRGSYPRLARDDESLAAREHAISGPAMASGDDRGGLFLVVEAFGTAGGKRAWEYRIPATGELPKLHEKHNLATPTPVSDGERIYCWFGNGQVAALDMQGRELWKRHLGQEHGSFVTPWGHGSSPMLYKDLLILLAAHDPVAYLLALDKRTGEQRWKVDYKDSRVSHSTPVAVPGPRGDALIVNSSARVEAYDPATGARLWQLGEERQTPIPSPVFAGGTIYMSRGYRNSDVLAIRPGDARVLWRIPSGASYVPSILHYQGLIYMTNEVGVVTCADAATGRQVWRERLEGIFFASPVAGDGKVYFVSETGETFVLRAGRKPEVLARNQIGERFLASPAISGGRIYLRSDGILFAIGAAPE
ncbi:MAG: PQQ-binding-like beta-propeller repeat protein [Bryobacteraceae bacterium]